MSLQHTALQTPEAGEEWVLGDQNQDDPNAPIQDDPNAEAIDQQQEQVQQPPEPTELEKLALELGWTPQDKWRGDPSKWTPAADYIRTTGKVLERTKYQVKQERSAVAELNARLARLEKGHHSFAQQRHQEIATEYELAMEQAAKDGNGELHGKLLKEYREHIGKAPPPAQAEAQAHPDVYAQAEAIMEDPIAVRFFEANPIALQDEAAWNLMDREMTRVAQQGGGAAQQFRAAEEALRYAYGHVYEAPPANGGQPHHSQSQPRTQGGQFAQQPQRRPAPPVAAASRVNNQPGGQSAIDRLPADAKAFLNERLAKGEVKDGEKWARVFLGEKISVVGAN